MLYKELAHVRRSLAIYAVIAALALILALSIRLASGTHVNVHGSVERLPFSIFSGAAGFVATIFAVVFGIGLANENAHHLPWVWTKPIARWRYALGMMGVHLAGLLVVFAAMCAAVAIVLSLFGQLRYVHWQPYDGAVLLLALSAPLGLYGFVQAATASLKRNAGLVAGLSWPVMGAVAALAKNSDLPQPLSAIVQAINLINPWNYLSVHVASRGDADALIATVVPHALALLAIAAGGATLAIVQWNRVEA